MSVLAPRSRRSQTRRRAVVLVLSLLSLVASCRGGSPESAAESGTTTSVETTTTTTTVDTTTTTSSAPGTSTTVDDAANSEEEIIDRYAGFWLARLEANSGTPDPSDPALAEFATDEQLDRVIAETQRNLDEGLAFKAADDPADIQSITVVSIDGDTAVVQECFVDDTVVVRRDTGEIVNDSIHTQNIRGTLRLIDGTWKVSRAELLQESEGISGCALAS